jgi:hypothetical protein
MNFKRYPLDSQNFSIELQSYSFDGKLLTITYDKNTPVALLSNPQYPTPMIYLNQLWTYTSSDGFVLDKASPSSTNPSRTFSTALINIIFTRKRFGEDPNLRPFVAFD